MISAAGMTGDRQIKPMRTAPTGKRGASLLQGRPYIWLLAAPLAFLALALVYPMLQMFLISIRSYDPTAIVGSRLLVVSSLLATTMRPVSL